MGVPAFFRWLSRKYPSIVVSCVEEKLREISGMKIPVDATQPNPNEVEFDNLYLDMNGIIHPCCHPEDKPAPKDEDEMMVAIFEYIDRIFNIVRPRRLLYMAIDGVAPRAKMNQQRSRRFRASQEGIDKKEEISKIRSDLESRGVELPPLKSGGGFDSNCITPGTTFMARLAICLQYFVHDRMNGNPAWQGIKVILSDANVPGEGEHKIMDYIRRQRAQPDHDPNTHHCLYGADADLIMLGLATHEPHFTILREEFKPGQPRPCEICGQYGHEMKECTGSAREKSGEFDEMANSEVCVEKNFIFIRLCILREYLERELKIDGLPFPFDFERAIDDWVFMCFFVGNDFLPHLPSLEIREGAIDRLIRLYKDVVPRTNGYLTDNGKVNLPRVQLMLTELGKVEDDIFRKRRQKEMDFRRRDREKNRAAKRRKSMGDGPMWTPQGQFAPTALGSQPSPVRNPRHEAYQMRQLATTVDNKTAANDLRQFLKKSSSMDSSSSPTASNNGTPEDGQMSRKRKLDHQGYGGVRGEEEEEEEEEPMDEVRLWESGWKERYYQSKFGVPPDDRDFIDRLTEAYTWGLCWVLGYYYQGCQSWKWFYPFHYAPFASDFRNVGKLKVEFDRTTAPFRPLEQLMGVFPAASGNFIPTAWRELMKDEDSPIIDFYPTGFKVDLNGKRWLWQGVALLPFVDEQRLRAALNELYHTLTPDEVARNSLGSDRIFAFRQNRLYPFLRTLYENYEKDSQTDVEPVEINPQFTQGLRGLVTIDDRMQKIITSDGHVPSSVPSLPDIKHTYAIGAKYSDPHYPKDYIFEVAKLLPGVKMPERTLRPGNWSNRSRGSYRPNLGFSTPPSRSQSYQTPESAQRTITHSLSDPRGQRSYRHPSPHHTPSRFGEQPYYQGHQQQQGYGYVDHRTSAPSMANWSPVPPPPSHPPPQRYPPPSQYGPPASQRDFFMPPRRPPPSSRYNYSRSGYHY